MQEIIKLVLQKLAQRQYNSLVLSAGLPFDQFARGKSDFTQNYTIILQDVSPGYLQALARQDTKDAWVKWSLDSFTYGCRLVLVVAAGTECFIPPELLTKWPLEVINSEGRQYVMLAGGILTYAKIMSAPANSLLILKEKQRMTALAEEAVAKKNILLLGRR